MSAIKTAGGLARNICGMATSEQCVCGGGVVCEEVWSVYVQVCVYAGWNQGWGVEGGCEGKCTCVSH